MQVYKINESFESLGDSIEFYKLFYEKISKFKSLDYDLTLKWGMPYRVYGTVAMTKGTPEGTLDQIFKTET